MYLWCKTSKDARLAAVSGGAILTLEGVVIAGDGEPSYQSAMACQQNIKDTYSQFAML